MDCIIAWPNVARELAFFRECRKMEKRQFSISKALKDSVGLWFRSLPWIAGLSFPYALLAALLSPRFSHLGFYLLIGPWLTAMLWGLGRREKGLPAGWLAAAGNGIKLWPRFLGLGFMIGMCWVAGLLCLVLPVLYAMVVVSLAPTLAFAEGQSAEDSLNKSYELARPNFWRLLVFWSVLGGLGYLGTVVLVLLLQGGGLVDFLHRPDWTAGNWLAWLYPCLLVTSLSKVGGLAVLQQLAAPLAEPEEATVGLNPSGSHE